MLQTNQFPPDTFKIEIGGADFCNNGKIGM